MLREFGFYYYFAGLRQNGMDSEKEVILWKLHKYEEVIPQHSVRYLEVETRWFKWNSHRACLQCYVQTASIAQVSERLPHDPGDSKYGQNLFSNNGTKHSKLQRTFFRLERFSFVKLQ
jgi:hypothetical protein